MGRGWWFVGMIDVMLEIVDLMIIKLIWIDIGGGVVKVSK